MIFNNISIRNLVFLALNWALFATLLSATKLPINPSLRATSSFSCADRSAKKTLRYGSCDNACIRYGAFPRSVHEEVCAENKSLGCALLPCPGFGDDEVASCTLDTSVVESEAQLCPGDSVIFDGVDVGRLGDVSYRVALGGAGATGGVMTDVYLVADTTGSMRTAVRTAQARADDIFGLFGSAGRVKFGVGEYKDEEDLDAGFRNIQALTNDKGDVKAAMNEWMTSGGGDEDEATLVALHRIATSDSIGWRDGSKRYVVLLGDLPGHEPTCATGTALTRERVAADLNAAGITLIILDFRSMDTRRPLSHPRAGCGGTRMSSAGQASFLTGRTDGALVRDRDQSKVVELIEQALQSIPRSYDVDDAECAPYIVSSHDPALPSTSTDSATTIVKNTLSLIKQTVCGRRSRGFACSYKYTENGTPLDNGIRLEFINVQGC